MRSESLAEEWLPRMLALEDTEIVESTEIWDEKEDWMSIFQKVLLISQHLIIAFLHE